MLTNSFQEEQENTHALRHLNFLQNIEYFPVRKSNTISNSVSHNQHLVKQNSPNELHSVMSHSHQTVKRIFLVLLNSKSQKFSYSLVLLKIHIEYVFQKRKHHFSSPSPYLIPFPSPFCLHTPPPKKTHLVNMISRSKVINFLSICKFP